MLVSVLIFLIRKSLWIAIFAVIGMVFGFFWHSVTQSYYSSVLVANTGNINNDIMIDHVNKLSVLKNKPDILARHLGITEAEAKEVHSIKAFYGIDVNNDDVMDFVDYKGIYAPKSNADTLMRRIPSYIYLKVSIYNEDIFPILRKGILQYLNSNTYIRELHNIRIKQKKEYIVELERERLMIDSLQRYQFTLSNSSRSVRDMLMMSSPEIKLFYNDQLKLYDQQQSIERDIELFKEPITIIQDFMALSVEDRPVTQLVLIFGIIAAFVGLFCALLWQYRRFIWRLIKEDRSVS
ncbi:MAG: hypothetical protein LBS09_05710 [Bacteroidales bacterium]|nr:hypothetical protein [Bacteroidales bacterium]